MPPLGFIALFIGGKVANMLEVKIFDDAQIVLLREMPNGKKSLVATLTGDNRIEDAKVMSIAFDLYDAACYAVKSLRPEGKQDECIVNTIRRILYSVDVR